MWKGWSPPCTHTQGSVDAEEALSSRHSAPFICKYSSVCAPRCGRCTPALSLASFYTCKHRQKLLRSGPPSSLKCCHCRGCLPCRGGRMPVGSPEGCPAASRVYCCPGMTSLSWKAALGPGPAGTDVAVTSTAMLEMVTGFSSGLLGGSA